MKTYLVGGSVRDKLLGRPPHDTDYLVTEATEEELISRGLVKVGQSFQIYLDRENGDEYTLANSPLEDLGRRDLTMNAMALDEKGALIDPFRGQEDLRDKVLRHVKPENFFTDPLRVIRTARFSAELPEFSIHPETLSLMKEVSETDAYARLSGERLIKELKRILHVENPSRFFRALRGAITPHFKELSRVPDSYPGDTSDPVRFAWLCSYLTEDALHSLCTRLGIQNDWKETASAWIRYKALAPGAENLLAFFYDIDAFRKPELLQSLRSLDEDGVRKILSAFETVSVIGISSIDQKLSGRDISRAIREERLRILKGDS